MRFNEFYFTRVEIVLFGKNMSNEKIIDKCDGSDVLFLQKLYLFSPWYGISAIYIFQEDIVQ